MVKNSCLQITSGCTTFKQVWNPKFWQFFHLVAQPFTDVQPRTEQPCANSAEGQSRAAVIRSLRVQPQGTVCMFVAVFETRRGMQDDSGVVLQKSELSRT